MGKQPSITTTNTMLDLADSQSAVLNNFIQYQDGSGDIQVSCLNQKQKGTKVI